MVNEDLKAVLTLLSIILKGLGTTIPSALIEKFLEEPEDEQEYMSLSELYEELRKYKETHYYNDAGLVPRIVKLGNMFLPLSQIKKWTIRDHYCFKTNEMQYQLLLNETEGHPGLYENLTISYPTIQERDTDLKKLVEMKQGYPLL